MTIIVVKKFKDRIEIASDSQTTCGSFSYDSGKKIEQFGDIVVGFSGRLGDIREIKRVFKSIPDFNNLDELEELFEGFRYNKELSVSFLVIRNNKIYSLEITDGRFIIKEVKDFEAIGSGYEYGKVAYEFTDDLEKIIKVVCKYDTKCSGKVQKLVIKN